MLSVLRTERHEKEVAMENAISQQLQALKAFHSVHGRPLDVAVNTSPEEFELLERELALAGCSVRACPSDEKSWDEEYPDLYLTTRDTSAGTLPHDSLNISLEQNSRDKPEVRLATIGYGVHCDFPLTEFKGHAPQGLYAPSIQLRAFAGDAAANLLQSRFGIKAAQLELAMTTVEPHGCPRPYSSVFNVDGDTETGSPPGPVGSRLDMSVSKHVW